MTQSVIADQLKGYPGQLVGVGHKVSSLTNDAGSARQVDDIVITTAVNSTAYAFTIDGRTVTYTSDATATKPEIRDGLVANARLDAVIQETVAINPSGENVRMTAKTPGTGFTTAESDANLTITNVTANGTTTAIAFGKVVVRGASDRSAILPSTTGQEVMGVVQRIHSDVNPDGSDADSVSPFQTMSVVHEGRVYVVPEEVVAVGDDVYVRHTAGAGEEVGDLRTDADTADADQITGARWETSTVAIGDVAELSLNLP